MQAKLVLDNFGSLWVRAWLESKERHEILDLSGAARESAVTALCAVQPMPPPRPMSVRGNRTPQVVNGRVSVQFSVDANYTERASTTRNVPARCACSMMIPVETLRDGVEAVEEYINNNLDRGHIDDQDYDWDRAGDIDTNDEDMELDDFGGELEIDEDRLEEAIEAAGGLNEDNDE